MVCKHLISSGLLIFVSLFAACTPSSSKKGAAPAPTQPENPNQKPTPEPTATPLPSPTPTVSPVPVLPTPPPNRMVGDWQSTFSDPNYFGSVTYTFRADGRVLTSLLIYGKGKNEIMAERHEFQGTFYPKDRKIELEHLKGTCSLKNKKPTLTFSPNETDVDLLYLMEGFGGTYLRLSRIKGGLSQDVHATDKLNAYAVKAGCFVDGRLNQFVPQEG